MEQGVASSSEHVAECKAEDEVGRRVRELVECMRGMALATKGEEQGERPNSASATAGAEAEKSEGESPHPVSPTVESRSLVHQLQMEQVRIVAAHLTNQVVLFFGFFVDNEFYSPVLM